MHEMKVVETVLKRKYDDGSLKEKIDDHLLDCGVTEDEIEAIRFIFLVGESEY